MSSYRLRISHISCEGRGLCAELLPELITMDDWGFPIVRSAIVPADLLAEAKEAVRICPMLALYLERVELAVNFAAARRRWRTALSPTAREPTPSSALEG